MRRELRETIHACHVPCIIVTHDLRDVACIGDRACLLEKGTIALKGGADEVMGWGACLPPVERKSQVAPGDFVGAKAT
jgi:ABC-type sulfate/molybdate transport systems ATPase subunit